MKVAAHILNTETGEVPAQAPAAEWLYCFSAKGPIRHLFDAGQEASVCEFSDRSHERSSIPIRRRAARVCKFCSAEARRRDVHVPKRY